MKSIKEMESRILKMTALIALLLAVGSLLIDYYLALGIAAGFFISVFYFRMLVFSVCRLTANENASGLKIKNFFGCFLRFLILGFLFWAATLKGIMFFVGTAIGFFCLKISIIYLGIKRDMPCRI
jgi:hypothetical protein